MEDVDGSHLLCIFVGIQDNKKAATNGSSG